MISNGRDNLEIPGNYTGNTVQLGDIPSRDQGHTGRCWIESALSEIEYVYHMKTGDKIPPLSSAFIGYHDLRWKISIILRQIYNTRTLPTGDALITHWLRKPVQDAGQRAVFWELIEKYGILPESAVPVSKHTFDTHALISGLNQKLRYAAYRIRVESKLPEEFEPEIYELLDRCLGKMPDSFLYEGGN